MKPYSQDLRERIIAVLEADQDSQPEIADNFGVSLSFVEKLWRRWRHTGSCAALQQTGGKQRALQDEASRIRAEVAKQPDVTLAELCQRVGNSGGAVASASMMCRELQRLGLPRKKSLSMTPSATRQESSSCAPITWSGSPASSFNG
jgi:putative transposase